MLLARQLGDGVDGGDFHLPRNGCCTHVECAAKNERKTQHVVDLVGVIAAARGNHGVAARGPGLFRQDLRCRIGQRQNQWFGRHHAHHFLRQHAARTQSQENIGTADDVHQGAGACGLRTARFFRIHQLETAFVDTSCQVGQPDVFALQTQVQQQIDASEGRRAGAADDHFHLRDFLAHHLQTIQACRAHDDGGSVLIIVEHRYFHAPAQVALDDEAFGRLDVLEIDGAERGFQRGDHLDQFLWISLFDFDVENVYAREFLEQDRFAFHHGLGCQGTNGAQAQHRGAVADDAHQITSGGEAKNIQRILNDGLAGSGHSRRIRQGQIALIQQLFGGGDR